MKIVDMSHAEEVLQSFIPNASIFIGDGLSLNRMWPLLKAAGDPHEKLKVVHIAGTSGKTSTAYYIARLLASSGKSVGLTVSPHVDSITERVQIDNTPIDKDEFCKLLGEFLEVIDAEESKPSYFEFMIVFILWVFAKQEVEYAVVETGMGGTLDSTNVITREDKICVITDIGIDHTAVLGTTISEIAEQKAGIIHAGNEVFMYEQSEEVSAEVSNRVRSVGASLNIVDYSLESRKSELEQLNSLPMFQRRNWTLAKVTVTAVALRDKLDINELLDPLSVDVPGRMDETILPDGTSIIMDGAHNNQKMKAFVDSFVDKYVDMKVPILLGLKQGKEYKEVVNLLRPIASQLIVTTFSTSQDLPVVSQDPMIISKYAQEIGIDSKVVADHKKAYSELVKNGEDIKVVTGSFYLLGQIRKHI